MIAIDTNILVYAHREDSPWHEKAASLLKTLDEEQRRWAIPWPCLYEFYNIVTHPKIFRVPTPPKIAWETLNGILSATTLQLLTEEEGHFPALQRALGPLNIQGPRIHDARIAVLCQVHGIKELWSMDRDFSRFPFVKVVNPLIVE